MKKTLTFILVTLLLLSLSAVALAGTIVTPNGKRALLWKRADSPSGEYVAYIPSGNSASLLNSTPSNNRYYVYAYGYNSKWNYNWYKGWINTSYYQP